MAGGNGWEKKGEIWNLKGKMIGMRNYMGIW
jgi:hypothetical protein